MKKIILLTILLLVGANGFSQTSESYFNKGELKKNNDNYKGAIEDYSNAIKVDSQNINAILQRAFCFNMLSEYESAIKDYTHVIGIQKTNKYAYLSRGSTKNKLKKYKEAIVDFDKVLEINPADQEAYNNRGFAKKGLGDTEGACEDWKKSKKLGNKEAKIILQNNHCR